MEAAACHPPKVSTPWWAAQDRAKLTSAAHAKQREHHGEVGNEEERAPAANAAAPPADASFDTTIAGPWMMTWPRVHSNRHTDMLRDA